VGEWVDAGDDRFPHLRRAWRRLPSDWWSPRTVTEGDDMYRRLAIVGRRLEEAGLRQRAYLEPMLRRFAGESATRDEVHELREIADCWSR